MPAWNEKKKLLLGRGVYWDNNNIAFPSSHKKWPIFSQLCVKEKKIKLFLTFVIILRKTVNIITDLLQYGYKYFLIYSRFLNNSSFRLNRHIFKTINWSIDNQNRYLKKMNCSNLLNRKFRLLIRKIVFATALLFILEIWIVHFGL